ncbi:siphovirus Gp157 family protein [Parasutterella excrementihominis]|uniref:siphovirus Gp157 family protein n=1 Tax=Parasutterella excrementihominis TaxID=487175 RepID=UPI0035207EF6
MKLYEIPEEYRKVLEGVQVDEETGEILGTDALVEFAGDLNETIKNTGLYLFELDSEAQQIDAQIKRLKARKDGMKRRADTLKNLMLDAMTSTGLKKVSDPLVTVYLRKSTATIVDEMDILPKDLLRVKVETSPDLIAIGKKLKAGEVVPGAHLEERQNVNIK